MSQEDPAGGLPIESFTSNEVISSLWNKNAVEKCRIGLADSLVYENGMPVRWYVTGKTGEVTKKRGVDLNIVTQRWINIADKNNSTIMAIIRQDKGILKFLTKESWDTFISDKADSSILSAHCFINGDNNTIYRNTYELRDKLGRYNCSSHCYSFNIVQKDITSSVTTFYEESIKLSELKATSIRNILDLATNTVVRYMEMMLQIKIVRLTIDYVIDKKSQIWMIWAPDAQFVRTTKLENLSLPNPHPDKKGRMGWAGPKYFEEIEDNKVALASSNGSLDIPANKLGESSSPTTRAFSPGKTGRPRSRSIGDDNDSQVPMHVATAQVNTAADIVKDGDPKNRQRKNKNNSKQVDSYVVSSNENKEAVAAVGNFPQPFKCKGDYCSFQVQPAGNLASRQDHQEHLAQKLFTEKEILRLRKDKNFSQMMEFGADGPGLAVMTMRSVILARQERRGMALSSSSNQPWMTYPESPRGKIKFHPDPTAADHLKGGNPAADNEAKDQKAVEELLEKDKEQRESFTKSMSTYYDQIRVCGNCYGVYQCLDWARDVLGQGDAYGAGIEGMGAKSSNNSKSRRPRPGGDLLEGSSASSAKPLPSYASATSASTAGQYTLKKSRSEVSPLRNVEGASQRIGSSERLNRKETTGQKATTWKSYIGRDGKKKKRKSAAAAELNSTSIDHTSGTEHGSKFVQLDDYLRGGAKAVRDRKTRERERMAEARQHTLFSNEADIGIESSMEDEVYHGVVLLACQDSKHCQDTREILEDAHFEVHWVQDGRDAVNKFVLRKDGYDCAIIEKNLPLVDASAFTLEVRKFEHNQRKEAAAWAAAQGRGVQPHTRRHPVICYTDETSPEHLREYMKADMDGCVSFPVNRMSLLNTVRAAVPQHLAKMPEPDEEELHAAQLEAEKDKPKVFRMGALGVLEGSQDSATMAAKTLPVGNGGSDEEVAFNGVVQIDADTRLPFMVLDASRTAKVLVNPNKPFFNLVVCHDIFDTAEKMKIFLRPMVQRYLGMQVLLWNYPGQAFTEWREEQLLNNEYLAGCLNEVLGQVGERGTNDFDTTRPFYILGFGNGASIANFYASHYRVPNLRGLLNVNGWSFVDSYLAGIMHDCINIFQCAPPSRPDLPVYFYSRFIFCKEYLAKVSVPLALNIYTAVHNSISMQGRLSLCKGVLQSVDLRPLLKEIDCPLICIHSTQNALCRPLHTEPFTQMRAGEVRSIHKALKEPHKTAVVWMKGGHEVFQENKRQLQLIIEQILTGFHENHDITFPTSKAVDSSNSTAQGKMVSNLPWEAKKDNPERTVEDKFIDNVLGSMSKLNTRSSMGSRDGPDKTSSTINSPSKSFSSVNYLSELSQSVPRSASQTDPSRSRSPEGSVTKKSAFNATDPQAWHQFSQVLSEGSVLSKADPNTHAGAASIANSKRMNSKNNSGDVQRVIDPNSSLFERQDNAVYGAKLHEQRLQQDVHDFPEVKEYMGWRLKRNKKRLQRLQGAAKQIQGAFRAFLARRLVHGIRRLKAAILIQRVFRGWLGRCRFKNRARGMWATLVLQRAWRGYISRKWYFYTRLRIAGATNIQRMFRGFLARERVAAMHRSRYFAASKIQSMFRRFTARKLVWRMRQFRNCSTAIQRIFRGHLGRKRATAERDKYIFSRSQSQGIEFGRQMLLEHKLHATRLQSDVTLLTQEKVASEEQIEALLEEISSFEEGVRILEKEMHQLSKVEADAAAFMDEDSKFELREQKMKLDREFGEMLGKIGNRKDMLGDLEKKLSTIDKARQAKEEELRTLERKLVVLLEEQQNELNAIKRKQDVRGAMLAASHEELMKVQAGEESESGGVSAVASAAKGGGGGGGGGSGPSLQEKKQAAQLMQSTETLMKFGFMSMSMTYFSSLNMVKALRTVSAQDTVMAALADVHSQRAVGAGGGVGESAGIADSLRKEQFQPELKPGQLPGQQLLRVSAWSVEDVAKWLQTLALGQYSEAFIDSAVDGEFLYDLNDDDLKNTLGIEHRLHRKKILNCVHRLKIAEAQKDSRLNDLLRDQGNLDAPVLAPDEDETANYPANPFEGGLGDTSTGGGSLDDRMIDGPKVSIEELMSLVRHSKLPAVRDAIDYLPNKPFDKALVQIPYVEDHGTVYASGYDRLVFHVNKVDEHGNTMLCHACQNGNIKMVKYLFTKGANPNHQNNHGQTAAHFAIAYKFFDLAEWMFENGASDTVENRFGLTPYDGLNLDGTDED